jgi:hypothetical protein
LEKYKVVDGKVELPNSLNFTHLSFLVSPGTLLVRDANSGKLIYRIQQNNAQALLNEDLIDPDISLCSFPMDLSLAEKITLSLIKKYHYKVENASEIYLMTIKNKDYLSLTEEHRKARHQRLARFILENLKGPLFVTRDPVWCDVFLRNMTIKHYLPGEIVYREFEKPDLFYIVRSGVLAVEKQIEVQYSNIWPQEVGWNQK